MIYGSGLNLTEQCLQVHQLLSPLRIQAAEIRRDSRRDIRRRDDEKVEVNRKTSLRITRKQ